MPETLLTSLLNTLDSQSVGAIAGALGEPEQSVSRCMETGVTSVLAGLAGKSEDQSTLRRMIDLAPSAGDTNWSQVASGIADPNSHMLSTGKSILSGLFGNQEGAITGALGRFCGLRPGATASLLGMAAPMVLGFLSKRMRNDGMSIGDLGRTLQREGSTIRNALPPELRDLFATRTAAKTVTSSPVVAQAVEHEKTSSHWLATALALGALLLGLFWLFNHARRPTRAFVIPIPQHVPMGSASREAPDAMKQKLPENIDLRYKTGSAKLQPDSQQELNDLATTLVANPAMHVKISGYTDDVGNATLNLRLSQARANGVMQQLVSKGISSDRLTAQGYGEEFPVADNSTADGRAQNRRVAITE